jgi:hypothetical protein
MPGPSFFTSFYLQSRAGASMATVLLVCPNTGREFSTGILTDAAALGKAPDAHGLAFCPYCNVEHQWRAADARIVEALPPAQWVENTSPGAMG